MTQNPEANVYFETTTTRTLAARRMGVRLALSAIMLALIFWIAKMVAFQPGTVGYESDLFQFIAFLVILAMIVGVVDFLLAKGCRQFVSAKGMAVYRDGLEKALQPNNFLEWSAIGGIERLPKTKFIGEFINPRHVTYKVISITPGQKAKLFAMLIPDDKMTEFEEAVGRAGHADLLAKK